MRSIAPYDLMVTILAGEPASDELVARAFSAPVELWQRALALEACTVQLDHAMRRAALDDAAPHALRYLAREATAEAVRQALSVPAQIAELAGAARACGARIMVLKGAAGLLSGSIPGRRSMADIDVLASPADAQRLHAFLRGRLGYRAGTAAPEHHLPMLTRRGALPVEVHVQLGPQPTPLDARIWRDAEPVGGGELLVPSPTAAVLHALEHGALVHWAVRYRLRDVLDVAEIWSPRVDTDEVERHVRRHRHHIALTTILGAAQRFSPALPIDSTAAWRTVRRVAVTRHLVAAHVRDGRWAKSLCIAAGVLAEASPRALLRPAKLALFGVQQAQVDSKPMESGWDAAAQRLAAAKVLSGQYR